MKCRENARDEQHEVKIYHGQANNYVSVMAMKRWNFAGCARRRSVVMADGNPLPE